MSNSFTQLDDSEFRALIKRMKDLGTRAVKVGVLKAEGAELHRDEDGSPSGITVAEIAVIHEYGAPKARIPERSFIRRTFRRRWFDLRKLTAKLAKGIAIKRFSVDTALDMLGVWGSNAIKATIKTGDHIPPPLAKITRQRKKSSRPLIDTGQLANSMTHEITGEEIE